MTTPLSPTLPRVALTRTMTLLLAGSRDRALHELIDRTCKPVVPLFATRKGPLRLVDCAMAKHCPVRLAPADRGNGQSARYP
jgi:hypothetical protein